MQKVQYSPKEGEAGFAGIMPVWCINWYIHYHYYQGPVHMKNLIRQELS